MTDQRAPQAAPHAPPPNSSPGAPTIDAINSTVAQANTYRIELIKTIMTLAAGLFAFTVSFPVGRSSATPIQHGWLGWIAWGALGLSLLAGLLHMYMWERYYITYRDYDWKQKRIGAGDPVRKTVNAIRVPLMVVNYAAFAIGVVATGVLAALNVQY